jgi:transposase
MGDMMKQQTSLPNLPEPQAVSGSEPTRQEAARVVSAVRNQVEMFASTLDEALPPGHIARTIWECLEKLDLSDFYASIRSIADGPGRSATDPQVLLGLWVLATVDGIGSARRLDRLAREHVAYRWMRGGVPVDYHILSDFRLNRQQAIDGLLTQVLAVLARAGVLNVERVSQDGVRVRASAGSSSFRRRESLERYLELASVHVERLSAQEDAPQLEQTRRERAAQQRAATEARERLEHALEELPKVEASKARQTRRLGKGRREKVTQARVSTTDPQARVMKMSNGGFRPAYNVQLATDTASGIVVGVAVSNNGSDGGLALPLERQVVERTGQTPKEYLMDGGLASFSDIVALETAGTQVYAPPKPPRTTTSGREMSTPRPTDTTPIRVWRERMATPEAHCIYKERASTSALVNAQWRERFGLRCLRVRGLDKVLSVALLMAVTHDLLRYFALVH